MYFVSFLIVSKANKDDLWYFIADCTLNLNVFFMANNDFNVVVFPL